jgi:hypothetical protein
LHFGNGSVCNRHRVAGNFQNVNFVGIVFHGFLTSNDPESLDPALGRNPV